LSIITAASVPGLASSANEWRTKAYGLLRLFFESGPTKQAVSAILIMGLLGRDFDPLVDNEFVADLRREFDRFFAPGDPALPSRADSYLPPNDPLVQADPNKFYCEAGFTPKGDPLSISTELQFLHVSSSTILNAAENGERQRVTDLMRSQFAFLQSHAIQWIPNFCRRALAQAGQKSGDRQVKEFFTRLFTFFENFLTSDLKLLEYVLTKGA